VDARVRQIAKAALEKLGAPPEHAGPLPGELRLSSLTLPQLSRLAYLQAEDPLVEQVLAMLKHGRPVFLDRPAVEARLGLEQYPPRVQEQFRRWFVRIAGYGVALTNAEAPASPAPAAHRGFEAAPAPPAPATPGTASPAPAPEAEAPGKGPAARTLSLASPDRQVLSQILGEAAPEPHPCVKEPGMACCGSGRCKTLGF
jgi:hypothetical protein